LLVVFALMLLIFGPNKLPDLARGLAKRFEDLHEASA
jgi:Sec-independent protein translocase protein TatA